MSVLTLRAGSVDFRPLKFVDPAQFDTTTVLNKIYFHFGRLQKIYA